MADQQKEERNRRVRLMNLSPGSVEKKKTKLATGLSENELIGSCDVCVNLKPAQTFQYKVSELQKLSQDESEVVKFIHSNIHCDINFMCPNHYKSTFKKFVGLNKICSNPMNKENHRDNWTQLEGKLVEK